VLYRALELTLAPALRAVYRPTVSGAEHVPTTGPVILAANHQSFADEFFIPLGARRQVLYFAKAEYFTTPGLRGRAMAAFFHGMGQVPVARSDTRSAAAVIEIGVEVLQDGGALGIFPEGTRSPDGRMYKGKTGVIRVALETGAPVIPVVMSGTEAVNPPGSRLWHFGRVRITVCPPLDFSRYRDFADDRQVVRSATDELMWVLANNSGQEYVDSYAADVKARLLAAQAS